jgi:hypothetical protein
MPGTLLEECGCINHEQTRCYDLALVPESFSQVKQRKFAVVQVYYTRTGIRTRTPTHKLDTAFGSLTYGVAHDVEWCEYGVSKEQCGDEDDEPVLDDAGHPDGERTRVLDGQEDRHVQRKGGQRVGDHHQGAHDEGARAVQHLGPLQEHPRDEQRQQTAQGKSTLSSFQLHES